MPRSLTSRAMALLSLSTLPFVVRPTLAQNVSLAVGPMAGGVFGKFRGADVTGARTRTAFTAGGFATIQINRNFAIESQALYVEKGTEADEGGITVTFKLNYIEVPVLFKGTFPIQGTTRLVPNVFVGPAIAFKTGCKLKGSSGGVTAEVSCDSLSTTIKSTDFVLAFGGGLDVGPITLQVRYDLGLSKIVDVNPQPDVKTGAWLITAGFRIPLGKK